MSNQQEVTVADMWVYNGTVRDWRFSWHRRFFVWEEQLLNNLLADLDGHVWNDNADGWFWKREEDGCFTVKSMYTKLEGLLIVENDWGVEEVRVFNQLWKSPAPTKVVGFSWRMLLNRIPTRENLYRRNALPQDVSTLCVMCGREVERTNHLFMHCSVARRVWIELLQWVGNMFIMPPNLFSHWACWNAGSSRKKVVKGLRLIWHSTIWAIWKGRNDKIFNNKEVDVLELVEEVKVLSWRWCLSRTNTPSCFFYEWCWDPLVCLAR